MLHLRLDQNSCLFGDNNVQFCIQIPTFRRNLLLPPSGYLL